MAGLGYGTVLIRVCTKTGINSKPQTRLERGDDSSVLHAYTHVYICMRKEVYCYRSIGVSVRVLIHKKSHDVNRYT